MIFGEFASDEALGVHLAHTLRGPGFCLRKGCVLAAEDLVALRGAGIDRVTGARLAADELDEDAGAAAIAALLAGSGVSARPAHGGRCNLHADAAGVLTVERAVIDAINRIDEAVAVATLAPDARVAAQEVVATVKIMPLGVPRRLVDACRAAAAAPLHVAPWRARRVALILGESAALNPRLLAVTAAVTRARLAQRRCALAVELTCAHETGAMRAAILAALADGAELILIAGANVAKDRGDVVPAALVAAGGVVEHFGMPMEPGNMLLFGRIADVPVVNLPGCARSPRENGLDWMLDRLLADLPVSARDIMGRGVGGLLRSAPAESAAPDDAVLPTRIAAQVLADIDTPTALTAAAAA